MIFQYKELDNKPLEEMEENETITLLRNRDQIKMNCSVQVLVRMSIKSQVQVLQVLSLLDIHKIQNNVVDRMPMAFAMPNKTLVFCTAQRPMAMAAEIPVTNLINIIL